MWKKVEKFLRTTINRFAHNSLMRNDKLETANNKKLSHFIGYIIAGTFVLILLFIVTLTILVYTRPSKIKNDFLDYDTRLVSPHLKGTVVQKKDEVIYTFNSVKFIGASRYEEYWEYRFCALCSHGKNADIVAKSTLTPEGFGIFPGDYVNIKLTYKIEALGLLNGLIKKLGLSQFEYLKPYDYEIEVLPRSKYYMNIKSAQDTLVANIKGFDLYKRLVQIKSVTSIKEDKYYNYWGEVCDINGCYKLKSLTGKPSVSQIIYSVYNAYLQRNINLDSDIRKQIFQFLDKLYDKKDASLQSNLSDDLPANLLNFYSFPLCPVLYGRLDDSNELKTFFLEYMERYTLPYFRQYVLDFTEIGPSVNTYIYDGYTLLYSNNKYSFRYKTIPNDIDLNCYYYLKNGQEPLEHIYSFTPNKERDEFYYSMLKQLVYRRYNFLLPSYIKKIPNINSKYAEYVTFLDNFNSTLEATNPLLNKSYYLYNYTKKNFFKLLGVPVTLSQNTIDSRFRVYSTPLFLRSNMLDLMYIYDFLYTSYVLRY